jgi:glucose-6-phosphate isomerase
MNKLDLWRRFQQLYRYFPSIRSALDVSRMNFPASFLGDLAAPMRQAFDSMAQLEKGAIANPDENRMVGHYWLRNPALAPTPAIRAEIEQTLREILAFSAAVHGGSIAPPAGPFKQLLVTGIGGSALGPQFVAQALGHPTTDRMKVAFFDNTDPDGMDRVLSAIGGDLSRTLVVVISKSGGTKETRNGMLEAKTAFERAGLHFPRHAVAVTGADSDLDKYAKTNHWLRRFPMWDWVGGRTSELSAVGLLPAALQGFAIEQMLDGARACDEITRNPLLTENPAALLAASWFYIGKGRGEKDMVVLPYKDRLELFSRYLQQLVMESLGKRLDLSGKEVHQGIAVYGNKGSTDQHAYVQQLRDGVLNFFVTFIEVLKDRQGESIEVDPGVTSGDYLQGFYLGTRAALYESGRESITISIDEVSPFTVGILIALFERAVGLYASLININAYHQPGVEAGKKAATTVIALQALILKALRESTTPLTLDDLAAKIAPDDIETIFTVLEHLSANPDHRVHKTAGPTPFNAKYSVQPQKI